MMLLLSKNLHSETSLCSQDILKFIQSCDLSDDLRPPLIKASWAQVLTPTHHSVEQTPHYVAFDTDTATTFYST